MVVKSGQAGLDALVGLAIASPKEYIQREAAKAHEAGAEFVSKHPQLMDAWHNALGLAGQEQGMAIDVIQRVLNHILPSICSNIAAPAAEIAAAKAPAGIGLGLGKGGQNAGVG